MYPSLRPPYSAGDFLTWIFLRACIYICLGAGETLPELDNGSVMCLAWSLCSRYSVYFCKHRYHRSHIHLYSPESQHSMVFRHRW